MRGRLHRHETARFYCATLPGILKLRHKCGQYSALHLPKQLFIFTHTKKQQGRESNTWSNNARLESPFALNNAPP